MIERTEQKVGYSRNQHTKKKEKKQQQWNKLRKFTYNIFRLSIDILQQTSYYVSQQQC